jgi:mannose-6-phosphate isomerase-like protein (cupin superfamily)
MKIRRVVTGHTREGKAIVASDTAVEAITVALAPRVEFHRLWGRDSAPTFPDGGADSLPPAYFPPVGGFRFGLFTIPPASSVERPPVDMTAAVEECEAKLPGLLAHLEAADPAMHTTDTVDFEYVVSGEIWLELDDGVEVRLAAGDTVVQNGTRHAWRNRSAEPCVLVVCLVGAHRATATAAPAG